MSNNWDYTKSRNLQDGMIANFMLVYEDNRDYNINIFIKCFTRQILDLIKEKNIPIEIKTRDDLKKYFKFERNSNYLDLNGNFSYEDLLITLTLNGRMENLYSKKCAICIIKIEGINTDLLTKFKPVGINIEEYMLNYIQITNKQRRDWYEEIDYSF